MTNTRPSIKYGLLLAFLVYNVNVLSAPVENSDSNSETPEDPNIQTKFGGGYHGGYHNTPFFNRRYSEQRPTRQTIPQPHRTLPVGVEQPPFDSSLSATLLNLQQLQGAQASQGIPQGQQSGFSGQDFLSGGGQQGGGWQQTGFQGAGQQTGGRPQTGFQGGQQTGFQSGGQQTGFQSGGQQTGFQSGGQQTGFQSGGRQTGSQTGATTENPAETECIRRCESTSQYNPVCGTDNNTYTNPNRLRCAQECFRRVDLQYYGICVTTTTRAPSFQRRSN